MYRDTFLKNNSRAQETDSGYDLANDPAVASFSAERDADHGECRRSYGYQRVSAGSSHAVMPLPLQPHDGPQDQGDSQAGDKRAQIHYVHRSIIRTFVFVGQAVKLPPISDRT